MLFIALPAAAQNTKGDRPSAGGGAAGSKRENRFRLFKKKEQRSGQGGQVRVRGRAPSRAASARKPPKPGKASQRVYPQSGRYVNHSSTPKERPWRGPAFGPRANTREKTGQGRNVYPQYGRYSRNPSRKPRTDQRAVSNRAALARLNRLQGPEPPGPGKKKRVVPRSASGSFIARKSINVYANFPRPKKRGEQAYTKDISGRKLRTKNFETKRPELEAPTYQPYYGRKRVGDRPYRGPAAGSYRSATRTRTQAWRGDITGRRIRGRNYTSKKSVEGQPILFGGRRARDRFGDRQYRGTIPGGGYRSATQSGEKRPGKGPLPPRVPGMGANGLGKYQGSLKGRRPLKGGGSVSGRLWNNNGNPLPPRTPQQGARAATFQGNIKGRRPLKGGGSVSGKLWNNKGVPIPGRPPSGQAAKVAGFPGKLRRFEAQPGFSDQGEEFSGTLKARRPLKGGGSVSGKLWNNKEKPIPGKLPPASATQVNGFPGKMKRFETSPGFSDQGEEFTGTIRRPRLWKDYIRNPNASEDAIKKKRPKSNVYQVDNLQVAVKQKPYGKKPHAAEGSLPGVKPTKETVKASEYARGVRRTWDYVRNPSSADDALKVREPGKAFAKATDYQGNIKMRKFELFEKNRELHPDAKFVKTNKNNVDGERDLLTNFKLWWARLFKKEETQPDHLKEKGRKPRYDKGEEGLWYD